MATYAVGVRVIYFGIHFQLFETGLEINSRLNSSENSDLSAWAQNLCQ